jgi:Phosphotransferase enzyme family
VNKLPVALDQITARWLSEALQSRHPGVVVRSVTLGNAMYGTATKVRLHVTYDGTSDSSAQPATLIVKGGFSAHRELMYREYMLESRFYSELAPRLDSIRVPRVLDAKHDDSQRQAIVILEDLDTRGATFCRVQKTLTYDQAAAQLDTLASLHAQWWESREFGPGGPLSWVDELDPLPEGVLGTYQRSRLQPNLYAECMALPRGVAVSSYFHDRDRMERAMERLRLIDRIGPRCLLHTDPHLGNWYLDRDGQPGLLDWQSVRKGPWAHDFNYCVVSSVDMLDRRAWERDLLCHYLEALQSRGVSPPAFDDAWVAYRQQSVYGLYYWLVNPVEFQVEVNNCSVASRFAFAAIDHDTFQLLA